MEKGSQLDFLLLPSTLIRFLLWGFSMVLIVAIFVGWVLNQQRLRFQDAVNNATFHVHEQLVINDAALSGFGSLLKSVGPQKIQQARDFTSRMRVAYPHIYMFEALMSVDQGKKLAYEASMQTLGYPDYEITRYVSKTNPLGKVINDVNGVPMYYPIFFIDPYLDSVKGLMGFDMLSIRKMREPLLASIVSGKPVVSAPYGLQEGGRGYTLIKALSGNDGNNNGVVNEYGKGGLAVLLVIKTDEMLAPLENMLPDARIQLLYGKERKLAADEIIPQTQVIPLIKLDTLVEERDLDDLGQLLTLSIQQPAGLFTHHLQILALMLFIICFAYGGYYRNLIAKYRLQLQRDLAVVELNYQHASLEVMVASRTQQLQKKSDENINLAHQLIRGQEDQIHHIARELHDEFGQTLTAIKINAHILESTQEIKQVVSYAQDISSQADALYETMHDMIQRLRPEALDTFGLKTAVEQSLIAFHLDEQDIELELHIDDAVNTLEEIISIASYRIVQELVNNAVKYAQLTQLKVALSIANNDMVICVKDNGVGFDLFQKKLGFGLSGVDERARSLGGMIDIKTQIGEGVQVSVRIPIPKPDQAV